MFIATSLSFYKRPEVQRALVAQAIDREVSVMFGLEKFGKRPDVLIYEKDVLELAKHKASSFHCSEELWVNPLSITTGMKRHELDELRKGWDLILDIDCPDWELAKLTAHLFVLALNDHGVNAVSVKFSGNKGFHVGVPFESFPTQPVMFEGKMHLLKDLFPEGPRKIASYLLQYIADKYAKEKENSIVLYDTSFSTEQLFSLSKKLNRPLFTHVCVTCHKEYEKRSHRKHSSYTCTRCGHESHPKGFPEVISCEKCSFPVQQQILQANACPFCHTSKEPVKKFNWLAIVDVDTVLIASRHLFRMSYSLHEKSGLVSVPLLSKDILSFEKTDARPENVSFSVPFLNRSAARRGEAAHLVHEAFGKELHELSYVPDELFTKALKQHYDLPEAAIPEEFFPPCMKRILKGLQDGKKRALFALINFLRVSGWSIDQIEKRVFEWNKRNPEPLREQYIKGQLAQIKKGKQPLPPPNCDNKDYYIALLVCHPDDFCSRINNPAMYAKKRFEQASSSKRSPSHSSSKKGKRKKDEK